MKKCVSIIVAIAMSCVAFGQSISEADFGKTKSGESVKLFTLKNKRSIP